jgi:hypothetical protein
MIEPRRGTAGAPSTEIALVAPVGLLSVLASTDTVGAEPPNDSEVMGPVSVDWTIEVEP